VKIPGKTSAIALKTALSKPQKNLSEKKIPRLPVFCQNNFYKI